MADSIKLVGRSKYTEHIGSDFKFLGEKVVPKWWNRSPRTAQYIHVAHLFCAGVHIYVAGDRQLNLRLTFDGAKFDAIHRNNKKAERILYTNTEAITRDFVDCFFTNERAYVCHQSGAGFTLNPAPPAHP
jgi:hypothetical protein